MLIIIFSLFQILFALFFAYLCVAFITGAPYVPSTTPTAETMIALSHLKKGMTVYDLGSGDGKLLLLAAKHGVKAVGFEINPFLVFFTNIKSFFSPYKKTVSARIQNFWTADLTRADVIFVYLLPWRMDTLESKLKKDCKKGTLIVSNSFIFPHLKKIASNTENHVYTFRI